MHATVLVVGDSGRSPRMQYHALALARSGAEVTLIAFDETAPRADLLAHPRVELRALAAPGLAARHRLPAPLFLGYTAVRLTAQAARLDAALRGAVRRGGLVLVQNPPGLPALPLARGVSRARGARLVVDWHNLGHAMLALRLGARHPAVALARAAELRAGRSADAHLCVSEALREHLARACGIAGARVVRDRPAPGFAPLPEAERKAVRARLGVAPDAAVLVSATSWSADEELELLLDALAGPRLGEGAPPLHVLVTGAGPRRAGFEARAAALRVPGVRVETAWLSAEDYPRVLAAADLGLCFHRSASGLDLPMKVADMLGCGLPVLALDYGPCLREALREGEAGAFFTDAAGLRARLRELLSGFPEAPALAALRAGVARAAGEDWESAWRRDAWPVLAG